MSEEIRTEVPQTPNSSEEVVVHVEEPTVVVDQTSASSSEQKVRVEEFKITGETLVSKIKELIHQGNIRRIILKNEDGHILIEIPLTVGVVGGVVGAALFPVLAAIGVIGALVAHLTIVVEKEE